MVEHVSFRLCIGCIALIQVGDGVRFRNHVGELGVHIQYRLGNIVLLQVIDIGNEIGVEGVVVVDGLLDEVVLRVAIVWNPAGDGDRLELRIVHFLLYAGNIGADVQDDKVIAHAVGDALSQYGRGIQSGLVACCDIVVHLNREGDALRGQLLNGLLFVFFRLCSVQTGWGLAVFLDAQFRLNQLGIVGAVTGVAQTVHGVGVVLTAHRVDGVDAAEVRGEIDAVVQRFSEVFVGDGGVPVGVRSAVLVHLVVVKLHLCGGEGLLPLDQLVVVRVVFVLIDGLDVALGKLDIVGLAGLVHLIGNLVGFHHLDGDGVESLAVGVPVSRVWNHRLFVALYIGGHQVSAVVPHGLIVHALHALDAQLIDHALRHRVHADVGKYRIEVWLCGGAVVDQRVVVRGLDADHLAELGAFPCIQRVGFLLAQALGVFIVLCRALDHFAWHRDVGRVVFMEIQHPLHSGQEILSGAFCFLIAVDVHPGDVVAQMEGPGFAAVLGAPVGGDARNQLSVAVRLHQSVHHVGQVLDVPLRLRIQ